MRLSVITKEEIEHRKYWISEIQELSGNFGNDFDRLNEDLRNEFANGDIGLLLSHLRLCGAIPESFGHDTSEEKLYSKYTDAVLSYAFNHIGLVSIVLQERADAADVECVADDYSFVADAKAFRLSRTAKNQKDFKVQAMDNWKRGKPFAVIICPVYQLPSRSSQIYQQAISRNVCILTYTHLSVLAKMATQVDKELSSTTLHKVLSAIPELNPSKDAHYYWLAVNRTLIRSDNVVPEIWQHEKLATLDSITIAKEEALRELAAERERIMRLSHEDAVAELIKKNKINNRESVVRSVTESGILNII